MCLPFSQGWRLLSASCTVISALLGIEKSLNKYLLKDRMRQERWSRARQEGSFKWVGLHAEGQGLLMFSAEEKTGVVHFASWKDHPACSMEHGLETTPDQTLLCSESWHHWLVVVTGESVAQEIEEAPGPPILPSLLLDSFKSLLLTHQIHFKLANKLESCYNFIYKVDLITVCGSHTSIEKISLKKQVWGRWWFQLCHLPAVMALGKLR